MSALVVLLIVTIIAIVHFLLKLCSYANFWIWIVVILVSSFPLVIGILAIKETGWRSSRLTRQLDQCQ
jgi:UPF0716 family protein affecting phage T7 exclusion